MLTDCSNDKPCNQHQWVATYNIVAPSRWKLLSEALCPQLLDLLSAEMYTHHTHHQTTLHHSLNPGAWFITVPVNHLSMFSWFPWSRGYVGCAFRPERILNLPLLVEGHTSLWFTSWGSVWVFQVWILRPVQSSSEATSSLQVALKLSVGSSLELVGHSFNLLLMRMLIIFRPLGMLIATGRRPWCHSWDVPSPWSISVDKPLSSIVSPLASTSYVRKLWPFPSYMILLEVYHVCCSGLWFSFDPLPEGYQAIVNLCFSQI